MNDNHIKHLTDALLHLRSLRFLRLDKNLITRISGIIIYNYFIYYNKNNLYY